MTGRLQVGGKDFGTLDAARNDPWTSEVNSRIRALGLHDDVYAVNNHVEMKAVAAMIASGATCAQVVINHSPCGSEPRARMGCDQYLPAFIPHGSTLTVFGTDAQGSPFQRTYEGKAPQ
ncbi:DddA-like double-stranded DNA deaminase toxin [Actinokineospora sp.]|uniref:DddA-like double-stranded DNA deaminase toxin n=1 Tax=Actinokineospora sp. TaxID=1872133 RepID=UPI00403812EF